jgi:PAS domain S-box-containing protein
MDRQTVLIVDDNPVIQQIIARTLICQYAVLTADDGQTALAMVASKMPNLILLDVMMPGMDGYEVCRRLKENPQTRHIPIIFVTAADSPDDELRGLEVGAVDYVRKPIVAALLKARVDAQLAMATSIVATQREHDLSLSIMDSLHSAIAVVNASGEILRVNGAWRRFAEANAGDDAIRNGYGLNYFAACRTSAASGETWASAALAGMHEVLSGSRPSFTMEYPCHAPNEKRWFLLQASPLQRSMQGLVIIHTNITERKLSEQQLVESEEFANSIVESAPDAIVVVDTRGIITRANLRACEIFGYAADAMEGRPVEDLIPARLGGQHVGMRHNYMTAPVQRRMVENKVGRQVLALHCDGREFPVEVGLSPVTLRGQQHVVVLLTDISVRQTLEEDLRQHRDQLEEKVARRTSALEAARAEAERLSRVKTEFLSNMSHEIRTPLNAILGLAQVGQRENGNRGTLRLFDQMLDSGKLLLGIINEILDFSKIEAGKLAIEEEPVSLKRLVDHLLVLSETRAREKGLALRVQLKKDLPDWVAGDFLRLTQVLGNLLSNAIKFTEMGGVTLSINRRGETLVFGVTDTGIGLTEEQIGRLFSAFEQADTSTTRKFGGTGLGLAISKRLVELMGGAITVTSRPEVGSRFEVIVPLREIDAPIDSEMRSAGEAELPHGAGLQRLQGNRILAAEDNPVNQLVLEDMLTLEGASLVCVDDGLQALDLLNEVGEQSFDLVLTDIQMPRMDGHQLAQRLRELYPELPVVGLTAHAMAEERQRCFDNGMVAHVPKPIEMEALIAVVQKHARRAVAPATIPAANIADLPVPTFAKPAQVDPEVIDWAALLERFGGRQAFVDKLVATMLANTSDKAGSLRAAAAARDFATIAFIAHSLKGTGGNMKARQVNELGAQTETAARAEQTEAFELAEQLALAVEALRAALICRNGVVS